jgi:hypothetical protein
MLRALHQQTPDHIPCAFMSFTALRRQVHENLYELARCELAMGLDSFLFIPSAGRPLRGEHPDLRGLPVRFHPAVRTREWRAGEVLHKEYHTPGGVLSTSVRLSDDWPHGNHIPFIDDYQVPRAIKTLVTEHGDLEALQYLLIPPSIDDLAAYRQDAEQAQRFTQAHGILLAGGWGVGMDMADWLCGVDNLMLLAMEQEGFIADLLGMIHAWNMERMKAVLSAPIDLYIRRAWYEGCDFVTPKFFRKVVLPLLKAESDLAHEHGAKFGYICSSGILPMLDLFLEAGVDVLIGVDPVQGTHTDLARIKQKAAGRLCVWGGVSGAVTVEMGYEEELRLAVRQAIQTLGPEGFILSPVDNITVDARRTWENIYTMMDEWRKGW